MSSEELQNQIVEPEKGTETPETETPVKIKEIQNWDELDIHTDILRGIYAYGFDKPSFIQQRAILPIISGNDVIAQAQSGTGKTGAFTISALNAVDLTKAETQVIIVAPTHELANQIANVNRSIGSMMEGLVVKTLIGGTFVNDDIKEITKTPPHIVVGTTGRIFDMIQRRHLNVSNVKLFILDEADEMLSRGFKTKIQDIFGHTSFRDSGFDPTVYAKPGKDNDGCGQIEFGWNCPVLCGPRKRCNEIRYIKRLVFVYFGVTKYYLL